ncbi:potassium voltage-gated channel subfamily E member 1-like [Pleurodeles waltl]|uniref:potassium voltage-gated channel subfamily E member 1-like n=1 Tax=Pleurodeles waltl TaxID=8319 RepID=UPI0037095CA9
MKEMNSTDFSVFLSNLLKEYMNGEKNSTNPSPAKPQDDFEVVYVLLVLCFFGFFTFGIMVSYIRSKKRESSKDPFHTYVERGWEKEDKQMFEARTMATNNTCLLIHKEFPLEQPSNEIPVMKPL